MTGQQTLVVRCPANTSADAAAALNAAIWDLVAYCILCMLDNGLRLTQEPCLDFDHQCNLHQLYFTLKLSLIHI